MKKNVVVIGTGRLPAYCVEACVENQLNVVCVEPELKSFSPLSSLCKKNNIEYFLLTNKQELNHFFSEIIVPTVVVSAYNQYLFPDAVLSNQHLDIINFHNSLLPKHRGRNAPTWAIFELDTYTGVTWHRVTGVVDQGEIVIQKEFTIPSDITAIDLTLKTIELGAVLFKKIIGQLAEGDYSCFTMQPFAESSGKVNFSKDMPNGGLLDIEWGINKISGFLRSMDYGKFNVFPKPRVCFFGSNYTITNYFLSYPTNSVKTCLSFYDDIMIIEKEKLSIKLLLKEEVLR